MVETVLTGCLDQWPHLRPYKTQVILCISAVFFLLGLPFTCEVSQCPSAVGLNRLKSGSSLTLYPIILSFTDPDDET